MNNENIEKKSIWQKELNLKESLLYIGVFILFLIYIFVFIYPKFTQVKGTIGELESVNNQISEYEMQIANLPQLEKQLDNLMKEIDEKSSILENNMEDGLFLVGLSNLMKSLGVEMVNYTVEDTIPYNTFYAIPTTIEVRGDYRYIRKIMLYLEEQKNMTQILDYNMETYIEEDKPVITPVQDVENLISDKMVYWTEQGTHYHKKECPILGEATDPSFVLNGTAKESNKSTPCDVCKPYTTEVNETQVENTQPKSTGKIVGKFKFIMYSSQNPKRELDNDDYNNWQPGKKNPFTTTTR